MTTTDFATNLSKQAQTALQTLLKAGFGSSTNDVVSNALISSAAKLNREGFSLGNETLMQKMPIKLSKRQKQLLPLLDQGLTNRAIARNLDLSEHTVKVHFWRLFRKLQVTNRTQVLYCARMNNWL